MQKLGLAVYNVIKASTQTKNTRREPTTNLVISNSLKSPMVEKQQLYSTEAERKSAKGVAANR